MLYYIIPPIIIVVSTAALIYFLFKKSENVPAVDLGESGIQSSGDSKSTRVKEFFVGVWLKILERTMHRTKLLALKFHNVSNERFHAIRKKRQEIIEQEHEREEMENEKASQEVFENKEIERPFVIIDGPSARAEKVAKPLMKQDITRPEVGRAKMVAKNQLEDVLIKRIAVNPRDIEAYERLGDYYMEMANLRDALECFRQVLHLNPMHHKARLRVKRIERNFKQQ